MPGMNSGLNVSDPTVVAAFEAVLLHQGLIALLIFFMVGLAWLSLRMPGSTWPERRREAVGGRTQFD